MAEDKPFDPTPSKIARARREGNVPRSPELNTLVTFAASGLATLAVLPWLGAVFAGWSRASMVQGFAAAPAHLLAVMLLVTLPLFVAGIFGGATSILQSGGLIVVAPSLKMERLKPDEGFKRMFSGESAVAALRASLAFVLSGAAFVPIAKELFARATDGAPLGTLGSLAISGASKVAGAALGVACAFVVLDVILARQRWRKKLRMDLYELKKDMQETEGNPFVKGRRKQIHRSLGKRGTAAVKQAAFVVANPTHISVAVEYGPHAPLPRVLLMAIDAAALQAKATAREFGIPIVENVALARQLYASATIGEAIPQKSFMAIAEIVVGLGLLETEPAQAR